MKTQCQRIEEEHLVTVAPESVREALRTGKAPLWLDTEATGEEAFEEWLSTVGLNPVIARCCRKAGDQPRAVPTKDAIFFEFPVYTGQGLSDITSLSVLCLENLMVTIHPAPIESLGTLTENLRSPSPLLPVNTISDLVCLLLIQQSDLNLARSLQTRSRVGTLDATMDRDPGLVALEQILDEKDIVRVMDTVSEDSSIVYGVLKAIDTAELNLTGLEAFCQITLSNAESLARNVERLESRLDDLSQRYVLHVQEKTNQRLATLTVISAIFLPLTLLAGIYGMNFDNMPELHFAFSYPVILGCMAAIAFGLWTYFKRSNWFD